MKLYFWILISTFGLHSSALNANIDLWYTKTIINGSTFDVRLYARSMTTDLTQIDAVQWAIAYKEEEIIPQTNLQYDFADDWNPAITIQSIIVGSYDHLISWMGFKGNYKTITSEAGGTMMATVRFSIVGGPGDPVYIVKEGEGSGYGCGITNSGIKQTLNFLEHHQIAVRPAFLNLISFNMNLSNPSAEAVFDPLPNIVIAQDDDGNVWIPPDIVFPGHPGSNTIDDNGGIKVEKGYNVYISADSVQTLEVIGSIVDLSTTTISLFPSKLNKISFLPQQFMLIQDVFSDPVNEAVYTDLSIVQDHDGYVYIPANVVFPGHPGSNTIDANGGMQPGKGYMIFHRNSEQLSFTYPIGASAAPLAKATSQKREALTEYFKYTKTGDPHSMFLKNINVALEAGDELGVFAGETCVGGQTYMGDLNDPLTIWCALPDYGLAGVEDGDKLDIHVWKRGGKSVEVLYLEGDVEFKRDHVLSLIEIRSASVSGMAELRSSIIPKEMRLGQNYPNPFNPTTTIDFSLNKTTEVRILIYNINGELVRDLVSGTYSAGAYSIEWEGRNEKGLHVASGIYIYRMKAGSYFQTKKMIFSK